MTEPDSPADSSADRRDNGLRATTYVPLTDVTPDLGRQLLTSLGRARIAAYLDPGAAVSNDRHRLYVAAEERGDARTIVAAALRSTGGSAADGQPGDPAADRAAVEPLGPPPAPPEGGDTDAAFRALIADWKVDTIAAVRAAERDLSREDEDWRLRLSHPQRSDEVWLDDDHYVPPAPPPLPRLAAPTVIAIIVLALSILILGFGGWFGFADGARLVFGIGGLLVTSGILLSRVREYRHDEDDDGSAV